MRILLAILILSLFSAMSFADELQDEPQMETHVEYVSGSGQYTGYCTGGGDFFCLSNTRDRARQDAVRNAEWTCQVRQGQADSFAATCTDFCNPNYLPPDAGPTWVSCQSNCQVRCQIPN